MILRGDRWTSVRDWDRCDVCGLRFVNAHMANYFRVVVRKDGRDVSQTIDFCESCADALPKCRGDVMDEHGHGTDL